jgi:glycosyltransferase involved in cell wall biosynthesis
MKKKNSYRRVLMLVENNSYPEDIRVFHEATALAESGYLVSVICQSTPNRPWRETMGGVNVFRYPKPISGKGLITYFWEYAYSLFSMFLLSILVFLEPGFDYIHAANPPDTAVFIAAFYKLLGKRFIFDHHDLSPEVYQLKFGADKKSHALIYKTLIALERLSCRLADHIIATNQSYKTIEMDRDRVPAERITVVRNGPSLDEQETVDVIKEMRQAGKITLLYLGVIGFQDGVDYLLRALYHLKHHINKKDFICVIAGDGDALQSLKVQTLELGLGGVIQFPGWIKSVHVAKCIKSADICLAPEPSNPLNDHSTIVKIMEYMVSSKPIVAFDLPEHRVTARDAAIYAEPNNEFDFARKIATLIDDPERCREMGRIGRERIEENLSWDHQKKYLQNLYAGITTVAQPLNGTE